MPRPRCLALALLIASPAFGQDDRAPRFDQYTGQPLPPLPSSSTPSPQMSQPPPPVQPVSPGTTVNATVAPQAPMTVQIPGQTIQIQQGPPTILVVAAPAPTVSLQAAPAPQAVPYVAASTAPIVQQSVQPVSVLKQPGPIHRCLGHLGTKMARLGQPYVTTVNQAVQIQQSPAPVVQYVLAQAPAPQQYVQPTPQAPRK